MMTPASRYFGAMLWFGRPASDFPAVVGPVQQGLALPRPTGAVARVAVHLDLADVARHRLPTLDLAVVFERQPAAEIVTAIPLEPAARVVLPDPALAPPLS